MLLPIYSQTLSIITYHMIGRLDEEMAYHTGDRQREKCGSKRPQKARDGYVFAHYAQNLFPEASR